jgi:hypothetical protein
MNDHIASIPYMRGGDWLLFMGATFLVILLPGLSLWAFVSLIMRLVTLSWPRIAGAK